VTRIATGDQAIFLRRAAFRTVLFMWTLRFLYDCGMDAGRLHTWYYRRPPGSPRGPETARVDS